MIFFILGPVCRSTALINSSAHLLNLPSILVSYLNEDVSEVSNKSSELTEKRKKGKIQLHLQDQEM